MVREYSVINTFENLAIIFSIHSDGYLQMWLQKSGIFANSATPLISFPSVPLGTCRSSVVAGSVTMATPRCEEENQKCLDDVGES